MLKTFRMTFLLDAFFLLRPLILVPVWGFCLLGYVRALSGSGLNGAPVAMPLVFWEPVLWIVVFSLSVGSVYVINQLADLNADRQNEGFALMARGVVGTRAAVWTALVAGVCSILVPLVGRRPWLAAFSFAALLLGVLYSVKPTRFSGRAVFDFLANGIGYGVIAFGAGWYLAKGSLDWKPFLLSATPYTFLMFAGSISSTVGDIPGDIRDGKRTTAVVLGRSWSQTLGLVFVLVGGAVGIWLQDWMSVLTASLVAPVYVASLIRSRMLITEATYKVGGATLMAIASVRAPALAVLGVGILVFTRIYFRVRHGIVYPSLGPARPIQ